VAPEYYDVTPDILVFGKGVGGGFPLAGVLADAELAGFPARRRRPDLREFPVKPRRGIAALEVLEKDGLLQACADMGKYAATACARCSRATGLSATYGTRPAHRRRARTRRPHQGTRDHRERWRCTGEPWTWG